MEIEMPHVGECFQVGDVTVTVLAVEGNQVRLAIRAAQQLDVRGDQFLAQRVHDRYAVPDLEH